MKSGFSKEQQEELLKTLKKRFDKNMARHKGLEWDKIQAKLEANFEKLNSLYEMESTGGEPDVIGQDPESKAFIFYDCAPESPSGRRNLCYDRKALDDRKTFKPQDSAMEVAAAMGIEMLTVDEYKALQEIGDFDLKTSSWVLTTPEVRKLGGAFFGDKRYNTVFIYHNGASSYYAARGFRGSLRV